MKKLSIIDKFIYFINTLLALALLVSYLLPYISPEKFPFLAILSLFVPALILINSLFVLYWLIKLKKQKEKNLELYTLQNYSSKAKNKQTKTNDSC